MVESSYAISCYEDSGDDQWIRDKVANGWQAVVHVQTNYGKTRNWTEFSRYYQADSGLLC